METQNRPNKLRFDLSAEDIAKLADQLIEQSKKKLDQIAAVTDPTWENCIQALADEEAEFATLTSMCTFPSQVSAIKEIRDASTEATKKLEAYSIEKDLRADVYQVVSKYKAKNEELQGENKRLFAKIVQSFERNGLGLPAEKQQELKAIKTKLADICIEFQKNLIEDTTALAFTAAELDGLPADFFEGLAREGDKYRVSLKYPEVFPVLQKAKRAETRRLMDIAREGQCQTVNVPLFEQVLQLRQREAELLGYESHAHFILAIRMAKTPAQVMTFLNELKAKLDQPLAAELARLLELKRAECRTHGEQCDEQIHSWDWRYYQNLLLEREYTVDDEVIKEYFPLEHVTQGLLDIYQGLLGLVFKPTQQPHVWHADVQQYDVLDADTQQFMGHFYLDLFPRDGKYTHAAEFDLMKHCVYGSGVEQFPAAAMVANFTKPQHNKPSLLKHDEVVTYFHEFGHVMHELCSKARYYRMSGTNTERDFVECPSQILENWCYEEQVLNKISKHYQTGEPLPRDLIQKIIAAKNVGQALFNRRQLFFGLFDMFVHTSSAVVNTNEHWPRLKKELMQIDCPPNANGAGSFGHLVGGYSAGYYGYLWSEVFAADMFRCWKKSPAGVFDPALGRKYRNVVLARGGTVDGNDMLREFLGREPSQLAFLVHIGLLQETGEMN